MIHESSSIVKMNKTGQHSSNWTFALAERLSASILSALFQPHEVSRTKLLHIASKAFRAVHFPLATSEFSVYPFKFLLYHNSIRFSFLTFLFQVVVFSFLVFYHHYKMLEMLDTLFILS